MRIKYNILWIENEQEWLETTKDFVSGVLEDHGFYLQPTIVKSEMEIGVLLDLDSTLKKFDLILVDFQLDKGDRGSTIITNIRDHKIYTEIIFYSQDLPGIRDFLNKNFVDGVYAAKRDGDEFREKFEKVFLSTIKKAQDISTIRGLVISETSELDNKVFNIIITFFSKYPSTEQNKIRTYIFDELVGNLEEKNKALQQTLDVTPNAVLPHNSYFDAYKKARILGRIIELLNNKDLIDKKTFTKRYIPEIIEVRNELAHCVEKDIENGRTVLETKKGDKFFDDEACKSIRQNIREHLGHLTAIEKFVQEASFT